MADKIPGLTEEEAVEFRKLMTPKVGPQMSEQDRTNRVLRIRELQDKIKEPHAPVMRRPAEQQGPIPRNDKDRLDPIFNIMKEMDPESVVRAGKAAENMELRHLPVEQQEELRRLIRDKSRKNAILMQFREHMDSKAFERIEKMLMRDELTNVPEETFIKFLMKSKE